MKATHTAAAILAAAAIFLAPALASAADNSTAANDGAVEAPVTAPVENPVTAPVKGEASVPVLPDDNKASKSKPVEVAVAPEAVAPVETAPEPVVPDQTKGTVLYLSQLPACDAGDGTVTSGGVPVNACIWAGQFVALR